MQHHVVPGIMKYVAQYLKSRKEIAETAVLSMKHSTSHQDVNQH
jgi:hypothetical protein